MNNSENYISFFLVVILLISSRNQFCDTSSVEVTFISNCGFMITAEETKIIIDAMPLPGYYITTDYELLNHGKLITLQKPFENINLVLISHSHPDHFHVESTILHLINNSSGKLVTNEQVISFLNYDSLFYKISDQIIEVNSSDTNLINLDISGISITPIPLNHYKPFPEFSIPHLAYLIELNGINILFAGDNVLSGDQYLDYNLQELNIDIAFYRYDGIFGNGKIDTLINYVNPKVLIPMHFLYGENFQNILMVEDSIQKYSSKLPATFVFKDYMESKIFSFEKITSCNEIKQISFQSNLFQNYPNPFNPVTTIKYSIPSNVKSEISNGVIPSGVEGFKVQIKIYDILGREIQTLVNKQQKPGNYEIQWDASNYPSGIYLYKLTAGNFSEMKKMILLK
ncbi:MAG: MBL fold metallo-hydrolase [Ignavibacteriales bacterium]|nr:MBL fold metallo-hydrolase [Ignavibacteriales bacterium]